MLPFPSCGSYSGQADLFRDRLVTRAFAVTSYPGNPAGYFVTLSSKELGNQENTRGHTGSFG
jgi:hypothetical protein